MSPVPSWPTRGADAALRLESRPLLVDATNAVDVIASTVIGSILPNASIGA